MNIFQGMLIFIAPIFQSVKYPSFIENQLIQANPQTDTGKSKVDTPVNPINCLKLRNLLSKRRYAAAKLKNINNPTKDRNIK